MTNELRMTARLAHDAVLHVRKQVVRRSDSSFRPMIRATWDIARPYAGIHSPNRHTFHQSTHLRRVRDVQKT
jgi:hypothetical protein